MPAVNRHCSKLFTDARRGMCEMSMASCSRISQQRVTERFQRKGYWYGGENDDDTRHRGFGNPARGGRPF
jgi:hypothetical protein